MIKIPTYLVTGFLGSGKTTLIKRLLEEFGTDKKIAVVQNEFAPHNIDGQELKRTSNAHFDLFEINNGSVFCVCLLSDFVKSFSKFIHLHQPEIVFFEASGLSDPVSVGELFNSPPLQNIVYLAGSICIIDSSGFLKLEKMQLRMVHQAQIADIIILNKTDLVDNYSSLLEKLDQLNPHSAKYTTSFCKVDLDLLIKGPKKNIPDPFSSFTISPVNSGRPDINAFVFKTTKPIHEKNYVFFLEKILVNMVRVKGYLFLTSGESLSVQFAGNQLKTKVIERTINQTELITMGSNLSLREIKNTYHQYSA